MAVQLGQVSDPADVGGFVQDDDQRRVEAAAGAFGGAGGRAQDPVGERGDQGSGDAVIPNTVQDSTRTPGSTTR